MQPPLGITVREVLNRHQGQGTDYETHRSVLKVREDCRLSSDAEIGVYLRLLSVEAFFQFSQSIDVSKGGFFHLLSNGLFVSFVFLGGFLGT